MKIVFLQCLLWLFVFIASCSRLGKRDVHKIILREETKKPKHSHAPSHHHHRHSSHRHKKREYEQSLENSGLTESLENGYENPRKVKGHTSHTNKPRSKRQKGPRNSNNFKADNPSIRQTSEQQRQQGGKNGKASDFQNNLLYHSLYYDNLYNYPHFRYNQEVITMKPSPTSNFVQVLPLPFGWFRKNNTYEVYEDLKNEDFTNPQSFQLLSPSLIDSTLGRREDVRFQKKGKK